MTTEIQTLDEALANLPVSPVTSEDIKARAKLMAKRIELDQASRAAPPRTETLTGLTLHIPPNLDTYEIFDGRNNKIYRARALPDGRRVIDVSPSVFHILIAGEHGAAWSNANQGNEVWQKIQPGSYAN